MTCDLSGVVFVYCFVYISPAVGQVIQNRLKAHDAYWEVFRTKLAREMLQNILCLVIQSTLHTIFTVACFTVALTVTGEIFRCVAIWYEYYFP